MKIPTFPRARRRAGLVVVAAIPLALAVWAGTTLIERPVSPPAPATSARASARTAARPLTCARPRPAGPLVGVAPGGSWAAGLARFRTQVYPDPHLAVAYVPFGSPYPAAQACQMARAGGMLMIQMNPRRVRLAAVAAGRYDSYLAGYAAAIQRTGAPVVFSFAHEMNGPWYPWGYKHTPPAVYVAAWRHMHDVFKMAGARNVIWCWNPNRPAGILGGSPNIAPSRPWWPGGAYVDWVGVDAYYRTPTATFGSVFGSALAQTRAFTSKPVLIAETGAAPGPREPAQVRSLFRGARAHHLVGIVWFDVSSHKDWRLEGQGAAIAAFREGATQMLQPQESR